MANYPLRDTENVDDLSNALNEPGEIYHSNAKPEFVHLLSKAGWYQVFGNSRCNTQLLALLNLLLEDIIQLTQVIHEETEQYNEETDSYERFSAFFCRDTSGIEYVLEKSHQWKREMYPVRFSFNVNRALTFNIPESKILENYNPFVEFINIRKEDAPQGFNVFNLGKYTAFKLNGPHIHTRPFIAVALNFFEGKADTLNSDVEKWLFILKNMDKLKVIPPALDNEFFRPIFEAARFSKLPKDEQEEYLRLHIAF